MLSALRYSSVAAAKKAWPSSGCLFLYASVALGVVQVADQAVRIEGIRIALQQVLGELLHLVHVLLLALARRPDRSPIA